MPWKERDTVSLRTRLAGVFRRYGLPERILADNGSPWGGVSDHGFTPLTVWLLHVGVAVSHGRPYHPQTQGKDERFHRTLAAEVLRYERFDDLRHCQRRFDDWREIYNHERPHEALELKVPASRYRVSERPFPEVLPAIEYAPGLAVRKVQAEGGSTTVARNTRFPRPSGANRWRSGPPNSTGCWMWCFAIRQSQKST